MTIQEKLSAAGRRPAGFDYLRIVLSVSIIAWHGVVVCYGFDVDYDLWNGPLGPFVRLLLPCFFVLSGFLVAGSLYRNDLPSFLTLRALRIFPALAVELLLSALVIGPLVTSLALTDYFRDPELFAYLGNLVGIIQFGLPGVFVGMPADGMVNLQLWTIPFELECYIAIALLALFGVHKRPMLLLVLCIGATLLIIAYQSVTGRDAGATRLPGRMLVLCFLFGACLYSLRATLPMNVWLFTGSLFLALGLLAVRDLRVLAPLPIAYVTVYLGLLNPPRLFFVKGADYSYGLFLYGFPIQQLIAFLFPEVRIWWVNVVASLVVATAFAALSWHLIEARVLAQRSRIVAFVAQVARKGRTRSVLAPASTTGEEGS